MYLHVLDARAPQLAEVVRALLEADGLPAIIGCAAGKDRTGVTIALLLDLCGVPGGMSSWRTTPSGAVLRFPDGDIEPTTA